MSSPIQAFIFDMDGVLVDSEPVILAAAIAGLKEFGVDAVAQDFTPFIGAGEIRFIGGVAEKYGKPFQPEMKDRVYQIYLTIVDDKLGLYPGVNEGLQQLRQAGFHLALASSADRIKIDANLRVARIDPAWFDAILSAENVQKRKPDPEIFLAAAAALSTPPHGCLVVEDALNGVAAAKAAGMTCYAVSTTFTPQELSREKPDFIAANFQQICEKLLSKNY